METLEEQVQQGRVEGQARLCSEDFMFIWKLPPWVALASQEHGSKVPSEKNLHPATSDLHHVPHKPLTDPTLLCSRLGFSLSLESSLHSPTLDFQTGAFILGTHRLISYACCLSNRLPGWKADDLTGFRPS